MKLTQNGFRLKCGVAIVLMGMAVLPMVDWKYMRASFTSPIETRFHTTWWERKQNQQPVAVAVVMITLGASLCFDFKGDPPPRKDPWEK